MGTAVKTSNLTYINVVYKCVILMRLTGEKCIYRVNRNPIVIYIKFNMTNT
jgi:hypothetical protein